MCGFSGIISHRPTASAIESGVQAFRRAAQRVAHRGDTEHRELFLEHLWLSHFRLAFQDVAAGQQPMYSADRRHLIVFNGEVYNHLTLRDAITDRTGVAFRTRSDTETLLEGWKAFGEAFFERLEGEYALVIAAVDGGELVAHRDRFGVKPLFVRCPGVDTSAFSGYQPSYDFSCPSIEFSSEIKGLTSAKRWNRTGLLRQFIGLYEPIRTPFEHVLQVPPGGTLVGRRHDATLRCELRTFTAPIRQRATGRVTDGEAAFVEALHGAVAERLLSDVELGVYLSGGVDSKTIAFELSRLVDRQRAMKSFTVGFAHSGYDETEEAARFARHLGFDHHVVRIDDEALNYSYPLAVYNSELVQPYTNGAAKWWLSLFTRQFVHGVLTGDGADELLCGYPSYRYSNWWKSVIHGRGEANTIRETMALLDRRPLGSLARDRLYTARFSAHADNPWLAGASAAGTGRDFVDSLQLLGIPHPLFGQIQAIAAALLGQPAADEWLRTQAASVQSWFYAGLASPGEGSTNPRDALLLWQNYFAKTHLPVLVLNWVGDRMEMANTLEGRTPFLANGVRRMVSDLPDRMLISGLRDKVVLRRAYGALMPADFVRTPKKQFNAPFLDAASLIRRFDTDGIFDRTGLGHGVSLAQLQSSTRAAERDDPFLATHLRSAQQTAVAMSIVDATIVDEQPLPRDDALEHRYLGGHG